MQAEFANVFVQIVEEELENCFSADLLRATDGLLRSKLLLAMRSALDSTTTMDASQRMSAVAATSVPILVEAFAAHADSFVLSNLTDFRDVVATRATQQLVVLREAYLSGKRGPAPASKFLGRTRPIYEFVRVNLGIRMHGEENRTFFPNGPGVDEQSIGQNVSLIHEVRSFL
jgi:phenylalanine ammonia-lyase